MTPNNVQSSCFIIGEGSLPIQCATHLLTRGHRILGLISRDLDLQRWAKAQGRQKIMTIYDPSQDTKTAFAAKLIDLLQAQPFDYLFSIVNPLILPKEVLTLPERYAINYHDAPLPKYAGMYATSWAIMNGEIQHGITWHVMTEEIDAGDILKQTLFEIGPHDTAFTLNAKCYDAAIAAFSDLIEALGQGRVRPTSQNLADRTYFPRYKRPPRGGVISWQQTAAEIDTLSRALTFGPYPNYLSLPKVLLGDDLWIVANLELTEGASQILPGTIISFGGEAQGDLTLIVATKSQPLSLKTLLTLDGRPYALDDLVRRYDLQVGQVLPELDPSTAAAITAKQEIVARHEAFWQERLATRQPLYLSYQKRKRIETTPASNNRSDRAAADMAKLPLSMPKMIRDFLRDQHWTPQDFLLTLLAVYWFRLGRADYFDLALTCASSGVDQEDFDKGFFAAEVPLQVQLAGHWSFKRTHQTLKKERTLCARRQTYARDLVVRYPKLQTQATLSDPLPISVTIMRGGVAMDKALPRDGGLAVYLTDTPFSMAAETELFGLIMYYPDQFEAGTIDRLGDHLQSLMLAVTDAPEQSIQTLSLLPEAERQKLLIEWNDTSTAYPQAQCIHQLFEEQVERTPDALAVVFGEDELTYRDLNRKANQLAHHLLALGLEPETLVGICVERSLMMVIGLFGILKGGGAYVPIDPHYPEDRITFMLEDAQVSLLLTQAHLSETLVSPSTNTRLVYLDRDWPEIAQADQDNPKHIVQPHHLAYVIYTSGSTGQPKGVAMPHRPLVNLMTWQFNQSQAGIESRTLQFTPISFDVSCQELFATWGSGGTLVLIDDDTRRDGKALLAYLNDQRIERLFLPFVALQQLAEFTQTSPPKTLREVITAGEQLQTTPALKAWFSQNDCGCRLVNQYGPTESHVITAYTLPTEVAQWPTLPPIGRPIANAQTYILDPAGQPVPVGVVGELYLGGMALAQGYLHRPDLTAERFIENTVTGQGRLYRTGDLARWLPEGEIEFLGRLDHQVKLRGFRIELGEIEARLREHAEVEESLVLAREDQPGEKRLVAYIVASEQKQMAGGKWQVKNQDEQLATCHLQPATLHDHLSQTLPDYMIPSAFVFLEAFPLTPNGKIDRKALPAPEYSDVSVERVAPRTETEVKLAEIWREVLPSVEFGVHDNFFALGGHSLLATQVISRIVAAFEMSLFVRAIFEKPTIAQLAEKIDDSLLALALHQGIKNHDVEEEEFAL